MSKNDNLEAIGNILNPGKKTRPRKSHTDKHQWRESDWMRAIKLYYSKANNIEISRIGESFGMGSKSMKMAVGNVEFLATGGVSGLERGSELLTESFDKYHAQKTEKVSFDKWIIEFAKSHNMKSLLGSRTVCSINDLDTEIDTGTLIEKLLNLPESEQENMKKNLTNLAKIKGNLDGYINHIGSELFKNETTQ